jgi:hypothetical protein
MSEIPNFKTGDDENFFYDIFDEKLIQYKFLLDKVRDTMFNGTGNGSYANVPGSFLDVLHRITRDILYDTCERFEEEKPEYKREYHGNLITKDELKQNIKEALEEVSPDNLTAFTLGS